MDPTSALELYVKNQNTSAHDFYFTYNSSALVGSEFGGTWEDPGGGFFKFAVKRALKQDQIVHMEGKLQVIRYFIRECYQVKQVYIFFSIQTDSRFRSNAFGKMAPLLSSFKHTWTSLVTNLENT